jgi:hypothetical protein
MFSDNMLDYAKEELPPPEHARRVIKATTPSCGDSVRIEIGNSIGATVDGCLVCKAATAKLCETANDRGIGFFNNMDVDDFLSFLDWELSPMREDCALTPFRAIQQAETLGPQRS